MPKNYYLLILKINMNHLIIQKIYIYKCCKIKASTIYKAILKIQFQS